MKLRVALAILLVASLGLAACGGDSSDDNAERVIADALEEARDQAQDAADDATGDGSSDDGDTTTDGGDAAAQAHDAPDSSGTDGDTSGIDDTESTIPDMENLGECMEISFAYGGLALASLGGAMGGEDLSDADMAELRDAIDELQQGLPDDIQDDFAVVADAYNQLFDKGFMSDDAQAALESDEFTEASANVEAYIEDLCA